MKPIRLPMAQSAHKVFHHAPEEGVGVEALTAPDYWAHVARGMTAGDRIEVLAGDGSYWAMLLVRAAGRNEAHVQVLQHVPLGAQVEAQDAAAPYEVKFRGPARKWSVMRKADKAVIRDEFPLRDAAEQWLKGHLQALAA